MYCSNCGKNNPEGSKFCQHCGIKMNDENRTLESKEAKSGSSWSLLWKIPAGIIGFCVLAFVLLLLFSTDFRNSFMGGLNGTNNTSTNQNTNITPTISQTANTSDTWISYTPDSSQFTVELPSYPLHKVSKADSGSNYDNYTTSTDNENTGYFIDVYPISPTSDVDTFLETTLNNMAQGMGNSAQITYREYSNVGSYRALNYVIADGSVTIAGRILLDVPNNTMYALLDSYYTSAPDASGLKKFLTSFQINTQ